MIRDAPWPAGTPCWVDLGTADIAKAVELAVGHGGRVIRPAADSPDGRMAVVADNQGAVFSLISAPGDE